MQLEDGLDTTRRGAAKVMLWLSPTCSNRRQVLAMRLEDGIDATRREDYLLPDDFKRVFGIDRDAWAKLPAWKKARC